MPGGQGSTYLDQLAILNEQDFLGGAAKYGKAVKEGKQNQTLVDLWNEFNADKNELKTTLEQQGDFNKHLSTVGVGGEEQESPEVGAYVNFMKSVDEMGAYANLYQPFITAFATLGDDGVKVATTLSNELATQLELTGKKDDAVLKQAQLKHLNLTYKWEEAQYDQFLRNDKFATDSMQAASFLAKTSAFQEMLPKTVNYNDQVALNKYMIAEKTAIEQAKALAKEQGIELDGDAFLAGLKLAKDWTGKGFEQINDPTRGQTGQQPFNEFTMSSMLSEMQGASWQYNYFSPEFKNKLTQLFENPINTDLRDELGEQLSSFSSKSLEEIYEMYKPNGRYAKLWSMASAMIPGFNEKKVQEIKDYSDLTPEQRKTLTPPKMNMPGIYPEIIRLNDSGSFKTQDFGWNHQWLMNYADSAGKEFEERVKNYDFFNYDTPYYDEPINIKRRGDIW